MDHLIRHGALGSQRRESLVAAIGSPTEHWSSSRALGHTGRGSVQQLRQGAGYSSPGLTLVREVVASLCYAAIADVFDLPAPSQLAVQVFPVWMRGSASDPPYQQEHVDNHAGMTPMVTMVYYAVVYDTDGGQLVICDRAEHVVVKPSEDDLVAFRGHLRHAVRPLLAGRRLSVVCNFYTAR